MTSEMIRMIREDYKAVLSSAAGKRVLGGIFYAAGLTKTGLLSDYQQGIRSLGQAVSNTVREIDPCLVGECEAEYARMKEDYDDDGRDGRDDDE